VLGFDFPELHNVINYVNLAKVLLAASAHYPFGFGQLTAETLTNYRHISLEEKSQG